jgi:hypothetical protein
MMREGKQSMYLGISQWTLSAAFGFMQTDMRGREEGISAPLATKSFILWLKGDELIVFTSRYR